jgi:multiple sugar transport system ATP-binding protein
MKDGVAQQVADPLTIYREPVNQFVAGFIGSPAMNLLEGSLAEENGELTFTSSALKARIPRDKGHHLKGRATGDIVLGIRPEDIYEAADADRLPYSAPIRAHLDVVEPMGNEIFLYFALGEKDMVARIDVRTPPSVNTDFDLVLDTGSLHFFDKETGESLLYGRAE